MFLSLATRNKQLQYT